MNQLQRARSPYLRQHAHHPVNWQPWGEQALSQARRQDRPILLSIGYSSCHWCHVMARESFEDEAVAAFMNEHFVNIKIDREERPDLDRYYMAACEAITGNGGWPLQVFLTPEGRPFHAGTYFPPESDNRKPSWMDTLQLAAYNFYHNRRAVEAEASKVEERMARRERPPRKLADGDWSSATAEFVQRQLAKQYDSKHFGFGSGAKFPNTMALEWLLYYAWYTSDLPAMQHLEKTVEQLLLGGMRDHLGGGFARYTVDPKWRVPHFEKMLYDNALIVQMLGKLYRWRRAPIYAQAIRQTLDFMRDAWQAPNGGFYAALDAETEGEEGRYYTWSYEQIVELLENEPGWFCDYYSVLPKGNWAGRNTLYAEEPLASYAARKGVDQAEVEAYLRRSRERLLAERQNRVPPARDEKQLLPWNALAAQAFLEGYAALGDGDDLAVAEGILQFIEREIVRKDRPLRHQAGAGQPAFLDGYAYYIAALLDGHQILQRHAWLSKAAEMLAQAEEQFGRRQSPLFCYTSRYLKDTPMRRLPISEEDMPSANAVMAANYQRLGLLLGRSAWRQRSEAMLKAALPKLMDQPLPHASWGKLLLGQAFGWLEIAIVGGEALQKTREANAAFLGLHVLIANQESSEAYPLLTRPGLPGRTPIYVCRNFICQQPVEKVADILLA